MNVVVRNSLVLDDEPIQKADFQHDVDCCEGEHHESTGQ